MSLDREDLVRLAYEITAGGFPLPVRQVRCLQGPYVYVWFRGKEALYIGVKTSPDSERPFDPAHHVLGPGVAEWEAEDELLIYPMPTAEIARWAERIFIDQLQPPRNKVMTHYATYRMPEYQPTDEVFTDEAYAYA